MKFNEAKIHQLLGEKLETLSPDNIFTTALEKKPETDRPCNPASFECILWPIKGDLHYGCQDLNSDFRFKKIGKKSLFHCHKGEWMLRDSERPFCLLKIEWQESLSLITINDQGHKSFFDRPPLPKDLLNSIRECSNLRTHPIYRHHLFHAIGLALSHILIHPQPPTRRAYQTFRACCEHLSEYLDQFANRDSVAEALGIHPGHVSRLFKEYHPGGFDAWMREERVRRAQQLLRSSNLGVREIATHCGIENTSWFIRIFKETCQMTPGQYRKRHRYLS